VKRQLEGADKLANQWPKVVLEGNGRGFVEKKMPYQQEA